MAGSGLFGFGRKTGPTAFATSEVVEALQRQVARLSTALDEIKGERGGTSLVARVAQAEERADRARERAEAAERRAEDAERRAGDMSGALDGLKREIEEARHLAKEVASRLDDGAKAQALEGEKLRLGLTAVTKQAERHAEQAEQTATALFQRIEQVRNGTLPPAGALGLDPVLPIGLPRGGLPGSGLPESDRS